MTTTPNNPVRPDEADLLAWVEGERLSPETDAAVARLLLSDPRLARELEGMRRDRVALQSLEDVKAPAGLIESVESALQPLLERQLLLGLQDGEPVESRPVVSMVRPEKRGIFQTFLADRSGRRMAMAAGLLLVVGGGTYWATTMLSNPPAKTLIVALNSEKQKDLAKPEAIVATNPPAPGAAPEVRVETPAPISLTAAPAKAATPVDSPTSVAVVEPETKDAVMVGPTRVAVDPTLAAELAREGKLVIRVVSSQAGRTPATVADHLKKECAGPGWKLASEVPPAVAVAVAPEPVDWVRVVASQPKVEPEVMASADHDAATGPIMGPPAPQVEPQQIEMEQIPSVYMLQARLDAATMAAVRTSLQKAGRADEVVFEERYESLPLDQSSPILNPNAMVWWTNPPSGWTRWGEVPVVIDPKR